MNEGKNRELSMEELDKITAGYPGSLEAREQILPDLSEYENEPVKGKVEEPVPSMFVTENERLVNELPYGELSEEDLDNVIAGRQR